MAHLVLGYPTLEESLRTAEIYIAAGAEMLELQIPFSHPTADGPVITAACRIAVEQQRVTVTDCLDAIRRLRNKYPGQEMMVMSYLNRLYTYGFSKFQQQMAALGIRHLIVPDLPPDAPLPIHAGDSFKQNLGLVPVVAANVSGTRLDELLAGGSDFFYLMSDFKITGSTFSLHPRLEQVVTRIRAANRAIRIGIGFGIETPEQVQAVVAVADYAIIGSALIRAAEEGRLEDYFGQFINTARGATLVG